MSTNIKESNAHKTFMVFNYIFLFLTAIICILPMLHIIALSMSSSIPINARKVFFWPVGFTLTPYDFVLSEKMFYTSFMVTVRRVLIGTSINMILIVLAAYPISKSKRTFHAREFYVWFFLISILFSGGIIPLYIIVQMTGLIDKIWALVLPSAVPVFSVILLQNFFKGLPHEIEESALMDGASHWTVLFRIFIPLSKAALATLLLFSTVGHWNAWFDGLIYMNRPQNYPLQSYLQTVIVQRDLNITNLEDFQALMKLNLRNTNSAKIVVAMIPILMIYPFLQKYFAKGIVLGSVKG